MSGDVEEISVHAPQMDAHHMQLGIVGEHTITRSRIFCLEGNPVRAAAPLWQDRHLAGGDESGQGASWLALSAVPKHRSRRLSPRIGQNLAQTIANGEIFTCS